MKKCIKCNVELSKYNQSKYNMDNYIHKCNDCIRTEKKDYARSIDKSIVKSRSDKHRARLDRENPKRYTAVQSRSSAYKRSIKLGIDFNLTSDYLESIMPDICPILGFTLKYGKGKKSDKSASIDRIDSSKGYTVDNVQIVSALANQMKSSANTDELIMFAEWVFRTFEKYKNVEKRR